MTDIWDDNGNRLPAQKGGFTQSFKATVARYDDLPTGKKADYERAHPTPRQRLAAAIQEAEAGGLPKGAVDIFVESDWKIQVPTRMTPIPDEPTIPLTISDARAILAALQEADRRELQSTLDGVGMP